MLESKWNEIEQKTKQKINKTNESKKLNNLNDFAIMRINLNSLVHPLDDTSDFEDFCQTKIKQLEKVKKSIDHPHNYGNNLITFGFNKVDNINTNNNIKSFLKDDNENEIYTKKNGKYSLDDLIEINKNQKKLDFKNLMDMMDYNDNNKSSIINIPNNFENRNIKNNPSDNNILNIFSSNLSKKSPTFLKSDNGRVIEKKNNLLSYTQKNTKSFHKYKNSFENNNITNRMNKNINNFGIKNKIEENYNYLYSLYPNIKRRQNNIIK